MGLTEYRRKRNFNVTAEPPGGRTPRRKLLSFVIQKHAASHLHYDFRLELEGVLKSWAVPKGPSLDPMTKRLAMHVEDHPLEYGDFEGIIPQGEYGGGTVMLWDQGTWEPIGDGRKGYHDGSLKFVLHGEKLQGGWMLVRKGGRRGSAEESHWFLFKERDKFAKPSLDITAKKPLSVTTGRDLDEIAAQANRVWGKQGEEPQNGKLKREKPMSRGARGVTTNGYSKGQAKKTAAKHSSAQARGDSKESLKHSGGKRGSVPRNVSVELATLTKEAPQGDDWLHEIKFDGYRMLCRIEHGKAKFVSRNDLDWTAKFPLLASAVSELPVKQAIIDGEVVVMQPDGTTSFQALQNAFQTGAPTSFIYCVFDLLYLDGYDLRPAPIEQRKVLLRRIIPAGDSQPCRYSDHVVGNGATFFAEAARLHLEGIVSKRVGQPYVSGRGTDWLKVKCSMREEFVIGGFTSPGGSRAHFGALAIGYFDKNHQFQYAGRVGAGFDERTLSTLHEKMEKLTQKQSPFANLSGVSGQARGVTWVKPKLVAQIQFTQWTKERQLRHPSFQGLRDDKPAKEVVREDPVAVSTLESTSKAKKVAHPKNGTSRKIGVPKAVETNGQAKSGGHDSAEVAGVRISHPEKVLYPTEGITKLDLARYYERVADWMLPHVENRLLSLVRCPAGSGQKCFFQKHPGEGTSEHLQRFEAEEKKKLEEYLALYDLAGLESLVQMGVLEIHQWDSQANNFEKPDRLIFDLDPDPAVPWPKVVVAAKEVRLLLEELELESFVKTTGGKGLHIVVPIRPRIEWPEAKGFCRAVADFLVAAAPDRYIATMSKALRKGKIFVDYLRNDRGATAIAPYSTRSTPGAPVSVPLKWEELSNRLTSDYFNISNLRIRLAKLTKDPWAEITKTKQVITAAMLRRLQQR